jgi:CDGSH-type Zn-finger protein
MAEASRAARFPAGRERADCIDFAGPAIGFFAVGRRFGYSRPAPEERMSEPKISLKPNGPIRIDNPCTILDVDGKPLPGGKPTVWLCRCGGSATKPFCDGAHKTNGFKADTPVAPPNP